MLKLTKKEQVDLKRLKLKEKKYDKLTKEEWERIEELEDKVYDIEEQECEALENKQGKKITDRVKHIKDVFK